MAKIFTPARRFSRAEGYLEHSLSPEAELVHPVELARPAELQALQLERLQKTLHHAYANVAFYKKQFDQAGIKPEDIKTLSDLARLPFTQKADLRDNYPFGMIATDMSEVVRIHASSGTTGKPTVVGYTKEDIDIWAESVARSMLASGVRPGDMVHVAYGYGLFTGGLGAHYGAEKLGCTVIPMSGGQTAKQVQLIMDFKPRAIMVTPSYMLAMADEFRKQGIDPKDCPLEIGIFGAEPWSEAIRAELESTFNIHAVDIYGLSEVMGPGVANECVETKDGLHIWEDHYYPEIIDPVSGEVLPEGEKGELVFTSLTKQAMPIIRYRTRDLTRLLPGTARAVRRMEKITGRNDDMIILRGVNVFPTQIEEQLLAEDSLSAHYQLRLSRQGALDALTLRVESREAFNTEAGAAVAARLQGRVKEMVGVTIEVDVCPPDTLDRSMGKAVRLIDDRPKD